MSLQVNLRHLEAHGVRLEGELPVEQLDIDAKDAAIHLSHPLKYDFEVENVEGGLLLQGQLHLTLDCQCVRCLRDFEYELDLDDWTLHIPLEGEDAAPISGDLVDLTPYVREDILLEFPQHPLCDSECRGLPRTSQGKVKKTSSTGPLVARPAAWDKLDKLKLKK
jgi:uncharacterized metal-binding protein YceD (DUF177 family)